MKIFVTGGTGFIGQPLMRRLIARGWNIVALVRRPDGPQGRTLTRMGVQCLAGDVTDRESMRAGMKGADIVVHNAAWYELGVARGARQLMHAINVAGTENVLGLALELGIPRTVYVSSVVYYGDSGNEARDETYRRCATYRSYYEQSKAEAHEVALQYQQRGLPLVVVCPAHVFGPNDHSLFGYFLRLYLSGLMAPIGFSPEMMMSPAHVEDIADGVALATENGRTGETYILAGDAISLRETFEIWATKPGGFKVRFYVPRWLAKLMFGPLAPLQRLVGLPAFISAETVDGSSASYNFSGAKARHELGWKHRPAKAMWLDIIDKEIQLLASRGKSGLITRLKPLEIED